MQQSLFRGKAISLGSRCVWAILCLQEEVHSICHIWAILSHFFVTFDDITKIVTFEDVSDLHRLHLCACPICSWSDFQRVRFSTDVLRDALDILTPSLWNYKFISKFEWRRFKNQNLQMKTLSYYFFTRWSVLMHHRHIKQMARPVLCTLLLCCVVYNVVVCTLLMLCGL